MDVNHDGIEDCQNATTAQPDLAPTLNQGWRDYFAAHSPEVLQTRLCTEFGHYLILGELNGEDIVLTENERPVARLVSVVEKRSRLKRGSARGIITYIADDFDAPLDDFKEYME